MNREQVLNKESAPDFSSKIDLKFFRHDRKESDKSKTDEEIQLTPAGRENAKAQAKETNLAQAVAFGSPRQRAQQTAGFIMAGANENITGTESLTELREKVDESLSYGSKIGVDSKLNFELDGDNEYVRAAYVAFNAGEFMKFVVEESDRIAKETGDTKSSTYATMAASIASIIKKYYGIAPRWDDLVKDETKKYQPILERFLGTHQGIQESFLAKLIELTRGVEARDKFIALLKNQGFDYAEGFETKVITKPGEPAPIIHITYKKESENPEENFVFDENISLDIIDQIATVK